MHGLFFVSSKVEYQHKTSMTLVKAVENLINDGGMQLWSQAEVVHLFLCSCAWNMFDRHYPTTKFTAVADTPENVRCQEQQKRQSNVRVSHTRLCLLQVVQVICLLLLCVVNFFVKQLLMNKREEDDREGEEMWEDSFLEIAVAFYAHVLIRFQHVILIPDNNAWPV